MKRPKIQFTLIDQKGPRGCHRGHKIGDSYDFDTERGRLCPMAMHVAFPYIDVLRYGGEIPGQEKGTAVFACPDAGDETAAPAGTCGLSGYQLKHGCQGI